MRLGGVKLFAILLFLAVLLSTSRSYAAPGQPEQPLRTDAVASVQIRGGLHSTAPSPLYTFQTPEGRSVIAKIRNWYNAAVPLGLQPEYGRHGYPRTLHIRLQTGKEIVIEPAYDCFSKSLSNGFVEKSCFSVGGEIAIYAGSLSLRAKSAELYDWINTGWKQERAAK
ncbi:hypothetical protein [Paenibacillus sp. R14(2021)]|uniref:hypothetical protein n=1 Tax=Paenibacillus sp. R14(2021) TaxID=2859228 RepID=UPI001C61560E|nr:hypothetical protein [Paenibacillus sp. R14(2021)]